MHAAIMYEDEAKQMCQDRSKWRRMYVVKGVPVREQLKGVPVREHFIVSNQNSLLFLKEL